MAQAQTLQRDALDLVGTLAANPNGGVTPANMPGLITNVLGAISGASGPTGPTPSATAKGARQLQQQPAAAAGGKAKRAQAAKQAA